MKYEKNGRNKPNDNNLQIIYLLPLSAQAAITKPYRLSSQNDKHLFSHTFGGWKYEMRVSFW